MARIVVYSHKSTDLLPKCKFVHTAAVTDIFSQSLVPWYFDKCIEYSLQKFRSLNTFAYDISKTN